AAVRLHHLAHDREPEAGSAGPRGVKGAPHVGEPRRIDPRSVVGDAQPNLGPREAPPAGDADGSAGPFALVDRVEGVRDEVHDDAPQLLRVAAETGAVAEIGFDGRAAPPDALL